MKNRWYAARVKPGYQRMAAHVEGRPEGELIIERNLRREGIEHYTPAYWNETVHHRKKVWLEKRYPLLVGYCFINLPEKGPSFEDVRGVDGIMCFLRGGRYYGPIEFPEGVVSELMMADFAARQNYLMEQHQRREEYRQQRVKALRSDLRRMLPKGRAIRVNMVDQANKIIEALPEKMRARVGSIIRELNGLTGEGELERVA